jgi:hypothetical protein
MGKQYYVSEILSYDEQTYLFEVKWAMGDITNEPYENIKKLKALDIFEQKLGYRFPYDCNKRRKIKTMEDVGYRLKNLLTSISTRNLFNISDKDLQKMKQLFADYEGELGILQSVPKKWVEFFSEYLYPAEGYSHLRSNQMERAKIIIETAIQKGVKRIYYMDGHGRMTACLLKYLIKNERESQIGLIVVEKNPIIHRWHKKLFPDCITFCEYDILNIMPFKSLKFRNESLVYLNFTGLHGQGRKIIRRLMNKHLALHIFISFSLRHNGDSNAENIVFKKNLTTNFDTQLINQQKHFVTYQVLY